ncbi:MAG TPA: hypothetical protein V6D47_04510 [Oscillatoriaceae cyanobacterium]
MRLADGGSGPLNAGAAEAAAKAAAEAAAKAAAEAAARAAAKAAAEAAAKRAAEAAAKAASAKAASAKAAKAHTGRLSLAASSADHGALPWGTVAKAATGVVAGSAAYKLVKDSLSAKGKIGDLMKAHSAITSHLKGGEPTGGSGPTSNFKTLSTLGKVTSGVRVISGLDAAADLPGAFSAVAHGPTVGNVSHLAGDALNTLRGADEGVKLVNSLRGASAVGFLSPKMNPVLSIAGDAADAAGRIDNLAHNWGKMSTSDKIGNVAGAAGDVADAAGSALMLAPPPADVAGVALKGVGAGLQLVSMGAKYLPAAGHLAGEAAQAVGHAASTAEHAVAHAADDVGHAVSGAAKDVGHAISHIFSGW